MALRFDLALEACLACGGPLGRFERKTDKGYDLRYDACRRCSLVQMNPQPSPDELDRYYATEYRTQQQDVDGDRSRARQEHRAAATRQFVGSVPRRHLDIGCSGGTLLAAVGAAEQVGVEPGDDHRRFAADRGIDVHPTVDRLLATDPEPFDLVTAMHVIEHVPDPVALAGQIRGLLAPGGRAVLEVPNVFGHSALEVAHLLAFSERTLTAVLAAGGLRVVRLHPHDGILPAGGPKLLLLEAEAAEPVAVPAGHTPVAVLRARRLAGYGQQRAAKWVSRQRRRATRRRVRPGAGS